MNIIAILSIILFLAFLAETLTEFAFGTVANLLESIWPKLETVLESPKFRSSVIQLFAIAVGIASAWIYRLDVVYLLGQYLAPYTGGALGVPMTGFGITITGVAIGKGSNYIHDILKRFFVKPDPVSITQVTRAVQEVQKKNYV